MNKNSLAAYRRIGEHLDSHYYSIYEALLSYGPQNAWDIANSTRYVYGNWLSESQTYRRLSEMVKAGWIEKMDWNSETPSGCWASVYWVKS